MFNRLRRVFGRVSDFCPAREGKKKHEWRTGWQYMAEGMPCNKTTRKCVHCEKHEVVEDRGVSEGLARNILAREPRNNLTEEAQALRDALVD